MKNMLIAAAAALSLSAMTLGACSPPAADAPEAAGPITPVATEAPAGTYASDPYHTSVTFRIKHMGLSYYTARFTKADITLMLDPSNPTAASVNATIDPTSIRTDFSGDYRATHPGTTFATFDQSIAQDPNLLNAGQFKEISFQSTSVTLTGPNTADIVGDLTMRGVSKPVTLQATFNGGYASHPMMPGSSPMVGFSARGSFNRSDFGISFGLPAEGSEIGVGDAIEVLIEAELAQPSAAAGTHP